MNAKKFSTWMIVGAIVLMILGIVAIFLPQHTGVALAILLGIFAVVDGIIKTVTAARAGGAPGRRATLTVGILGIIAGLVTVIVPIAGLTAFAWAVGIWLVIRGVLDLIMAFRTNHISGAPKVMLVISGILWLVVAAVVFSAPLATATVFVVFAGFVAVAIGVFTLFGGVLLRGVDTTWLNSEHVRR